MPITFRCDKCRNKLSTAKRKAGSTVTCPNCGAEVRVPTAADKLDKKVEKLLATAAARAEANGQVAAEAPPPEPEPPPEPPPAPVPPPPPAKPPVARRAKPAPLPSPAKLNELPLFEREDFADLLEKDAQASDDEKEPIPLPAEPPPTADGFLVTRGTATMVMVAVVVLLGLAFAIGYLVGSSRG